MDDKIPPIPLSDNPRSSKGLASRRKGPSLKTGFTNIVPNDAPRESIAARTLSKCTTININDQMISVDPQDIEVVHQLGKGAYGIVEQRTAVDQEQKRFLMVMDILVKAVDCSYIVKFYGALF